MTAKITTLRTLYVHVILNENGDLSLLFYFLKQCLLGNIQGKFQKNSSVTLISEESP